MPIRKQRHRLRLLLLSLQVVVLQLPVMASPDPRPWTVKVFGASAPGSGVVVGSSSDGALVLTAGHVLEGTSLDDHPTVVLPDGRELAVRSIRFLQGLDLAEIRVPWPHAPYPVLSLEPHRGGPIWLGGYPQETLRFWLSKGPSDEQGQSATARPGGYALLHGASSAVGLSGSGLYNERGELVAIHGEADVIWTQSGQVFKSGVGLGIPIAFWRRANEGDPVDQSPPLLQDQLLHASWLESMGRFPSAIKVLDSLQKSHPDDRRVLQRRASVLLANRSFKRALQDLDELLARFPNDAALLINRGNALLGLKRHVLALNSYEAGLEKEPRLVWGYVNKAKAEQALGRWIDAKTSLDYAIQLSPRDPVALRERASVHHKLRLYKEALVDLDLLLTHRTSDPDLWSRRGLVRGEIGDLAGSIDDLTMAIQLQPHDPLHRLNRGATLARLKRWSDAESDFEEARQSLPRHPVLLANLGEALFARGEVSKACSFAKYATALGVVWTQGRWRQDYRNACAPH